MLGLSGNLSGAPGRQFFLKGMILKWWKFRLGAELVFRLQLMGLYTWTLTLQDRQVPVRALSAGSHRHSTGHLRWRGPSTCCTFVSGGCEDAGFWTHPRASDSEGLGWGPQKVALSQADQGMQAVHGSHSGQQWQSRHASSQATCALKEVTSEPRLRGGPDWDGFLGLAHATHRRQLFGHAAFMDSCCRPRFQGVRRTC